MAKATKAKAASKAKTFPSAPPRDIHQEVTDQIIRMLEKGVRPWSRSWGGADGIAMQRPLRHNDQPYHGINVMILWMSAFEYSFTNPYWMTLKQANEYGGRVKKGEHGTPIVFFNRRVIDAGTVDERFIPILRTFVVFNASQIDNLPEKFKPEPVVVETGSHQRIPHADAFFDSMGATVKHGGSRAFYSPSQDRVQLPKFETFNSAEAYYATKGHEYIHWTRHAKRLNRNLGRERWGDEGYAMEELVAELGAAYLGADLNLYVEPREDHASYLAHWLTVLKDDKKAIFFAATHAEKAVKFLHELSTATAVSTVEGDEDDSETDQRLAA